MFFFFPIGVEGGSVRFPVVGLGILVACFVMFMGTWVIEDDPMGIDRSTADAVFEYWIKRPYLQVPSEFDRRFVSDEGRREMEAIRQRYLAGREQPPEEVRESEQGELDALGDVAVASVRLTAFRQLALTPARGLKQVGWLTHMFLHAGWLHLIGNMLFLYAVALLLEDAWGRKLFLAFYLVGGFVAAAAQLLMDRQSQAIMVGASGAVAACIGAAVVRFATRKMRVGYLVVFGFFNRFGSFAVPMWLFGAFKGGSEVYDLATGSAPGVAVAAHVGGMAFGAAIALGMKAAGLDRQLVATDEVIEPFARSVHAEVEQGTLALSGGDRAEARRLFELALEKHAGDVDAEWGLLGLELGEHDRAGAMRRLERVMQALLRDGQRERAATMFLSVLPSWEAGELRPGFAWQMAKAIDGLEGADLRALQVLYRRAGDEPSASAPRALIRAAELALDAQDAGAAADAIDAAKPLQMAREFSARLPGLEERLSGLARRSHVAPGAGRDDGPVGRMLELPGATRGGSHLELDRGLRGSEGFRRAQAPNVVSGLELDPSRRARPAPPAPSSAGELELPALASADELDLPAPPAAFSGESFAPSDAWNRPTSPGHDAVTQPVPVLAVPAAPMPVFARQRRVHAVAVSAARADALTLQSAGATRVVWLRDIRAIGVGVVLSGARSVLTVLLVLEAGNESTPATVLRLDSDGGGVERLRPQIPPREAWLQFVSWLAERTDAPTFPSRERLFKGQFQRYAEASAFETAFFNTREAL